MNTELNNEENLQKGDNSENNEVRGNAFPHFECVHFKQDHELPHQIRLERNFEN
jgi:hypothetical protein